MHKVFSFSKCVWSSVFSSVLQTILGSQLRLLWTTKVSMITKWRWSCTFYLFTLKVGSKYTYIILGGSSVQSTNEPCPLNTMDLPIWSGEGIKQKNIRIPNANNTTAGTSMAYCNKKKRYAQYQVLMTIIRNYDWRAHSFNYCFLKVTKFMKLFTDLKSK